MKNKPEYHTHDLAGNKYGEMKQAEKIFTEAGMPNMAKLARTVRSFLLPECSACGNPHNVKYCPVMIEQGYERASGRGA